MTAKTLGAALLATSCSLSATAGSAPKSEASANDRIVFKTTVNGSKGVVRCGLFKRAGWLEDPVRAATARINGKIALCVFSRVEKGVYGISAFHDENQNGKLDTNFIGVPVEDYCASRNARGTFGPPSFEDAKFSYAGGEKTLSARMK